jgi:hypothetical protein
LKYVTIKMGFKDTLVSEKNQQFTYYIIQFMWCP